MYQRVFMRQRFCPPVSLPLGMKIKFYKFFMMMFLRILFCSFLILVAYSSQAQHEWIKQNNPYLRIKTHQPGIYYLTLPSLTNAGVPASIDPRTLQLFHRGKEQQILVSGETDGSFDTKDTLYFYGQKNDGLQDSSLYKQASNHLHPWLNLHSDTAVYFLSWGSQNGLRMSLPNFSSSSMASFHQEQVSVYFHEEYTRGKMYYGEVNSSTFDVGEGWCSTSFFDSYSFTLNNITNVYAGIDPTLEIKIVGRNHYYKNRKVLVKIGNPLSPSYQDTIEGLPDFEKASLAFTIPYQLLSGNALKITLEPLAESQFSNNFIAVYYCKLSYAQSYLTPASQQKTYHTIESSATQSAKLKWNSIRAPMVFDLSHPDQVDLLPSSYNGSILSVSYPSHTDSFLVVSRVSLLQPDETVLKHYSLPDLTSDYYIVSHPVLESAVEQYAAYRSSSTGGNYVVDIEWITDLYDLFAYGEYTPLALFRYSNYLSVHHPEARFLTLIGNGVDLSVLNESGYYRWNPKSFHQQTDEKLRLVNLIPTAGSPGSDLLYVMDKDLHPQLAIGRIPGKSSEQVIHYLNKVIEQEALTSYGKNLIHLSGGNSVNEGIYFRSFTNSYQSIVEQSIWKGKVSREFHKTSFSFPITNVNLSNDVNAGVSFITFFGHASFTISDPNFGYVSDPANGFNNKGKYPLLIMNGCAAGNIFQSYSFVEDWVKTPDRGAIAALGPSEITFTTFAHTYCTNLYKHLFDKLENIGKPIGEIINSHLNDPSITLEELIKTQVILCGDPAVVVNAEKNVTSVTPQEHSSSYMAIRPNPNQGAFTLESKMDGTLEVLSASGSVVYENKITTGTNAIQLELPPGMYLVRLTGIHHQESLKVLID